MIIKKNFNYFLLIALFAIFCPFISQGQVSSGVSLLQLTLSPNKPEPLQNVKATLVSYYYDLDRTKITWYVNGLKKVGDVGLKEFTTTAGKNGQKTTIKAVAETQEGTKEMEVSFTPSVVDLIYESLAYTPPFYKGRALNPNQGVVLVTAIPELIKSTGEKIPVKSIIYTWKKDGKGQSDSSGVGKNVFVFNGTIPIKDSTIEVTASSPEGDLTATKQIKITNTDPQIVFYENSPIYGYMFNKAIKGTVKMSSDEFSILAVPYFFSVGYPTTPDLNYTWSMNGKNVSSQDPKNSFTTRIEKAGAGIANIGLKISNNVRIFQLSDNSYSISFDKK